jgi:hypothetical protein
MITALGSGAGYDWMLLVAKAGASAHRPHSCGTRDLVYVPTLEELIAACGEQLGEMARLSDGSFEVTARGGTVIQMGKSPTEAVARLWLVLNCI